jgi:molybdopterin adenylyltransferase
MRIGIVTVSDRASRGEYEDLSGPAASRALEAALGEDWEPVVRLVADETDEIEAVLIDLADREGCSLVFTTGGTGPTLRDVTPEATEKVCHRLMPGFGEHMRALSMGQVPTAILSRQTAGLRGRTLIVNLPGKPQAVTACLPAILPAALHCVRLLGEDGK